MSLPAYDRPMKPPTDNGKADRVGLGDAIIMGLSSSGPSQTLAVSLAALVAASGYGGLVPILICFVPMMGIAIAYQRLNRWEQSSGATYTWVAKVFHPYLGFLSGWMILLYYTLGTTTLTIPAGIYTLELLRPSLVESHWAIFAIGAAWNVLITALAILGLKIVARFEWVIVVFEYAVLLIVAHCRFDGASAWCHRRAVLLALVFMGWHGRHERTDGWDIDRVFHVFGLGRGNLCQRGDHGSRQQSRQGGGDERRDACRRVFDHHLCVPRRARRPMSCRRTPAMPYPRSVLDCCTNHGIRSWRWSC